MSLPRTPRQPSIRNAQRLVGAQHAEPLLARKCDAKDLFLSPSATDTL
jgi:hypothetical protein